MPNCGDDQKARKGNKQILVYTEICSSLDHPTGDQHLTITDGATHTIDIPLVSQEISCFHGRCPWFQAEI